MTLAERGSVPLRVEAMDHPRLVTYRWNNDDALERLPGELDVDTPRSSRSPSNRSPGVPG